MKNICDEEHEYENKKICRLKKHADRKRDESRRLRQEFWDGVTKEQWNYAMFTADMDYYGWQW